MKLSQQELQEVNNFITSYKRINNELTNITNQLKELTFRQHALTEQLIEARTNENIFAEQIKNKYGEGSFNIQTLEYQLKN